jgi:hypothetical protein
MVTLVALITTTPLLENTQAFMTIPTALLWTAIP